LAHLVKGTFSSCKPTEGSLLFSMHITGPLPKPDDASPLPPTQFLWHFISYYPSIYASIFQVVSFPQIFLSTIACVCLS